MSKLLFILWLRLVRSWKSPLLYWVFRYTKYWRRTLPDKWETVKHYSPDKFSEVLAIYDYLWDMWQGWLDASPEEKDFFFLEDRKYFRDCDGWSRMWFWYWKFHGRPVWEIAMLNLEERNAHMVTVALLEDGKYHLFDYRPAGKAKSMGAVLFLNVVGYKKFAWAINKRSAGRRIDGFGK